MTVLPDAAETVISTSQTQSLLTDLTSAITALSSIRMTAVPVTDLYVLNNPFVLTTCAGNHAFEDISKPLDTIWDGTAQTFFLF